MHAAPAPKNKDEPEFEVWRGNQRRMELTAENTEYIAMN